MEVKGHKISGKVMKSTTKTIKYRKCNENDFLDEGSIAKFKTTQKFGVNLICPDNRSEIILEGMQGSSWFKLNTFRIKIKKCDRNNLEDVKCKSQREIDDKIKQIKVGLVTN